MQLVLLDLFIVPEESRSELLDNARWSARFLRSLPGFVEGFILEKTDGDSPHNIVTTAVWESETAFENAKKAAQAEFQKAGFNAGEIMKKLNVHFTRAVYARTPY
jgi:heme-degrading monooxygenase HmoA